ncbi:MAG: DUF2764 family protein [Bacteroidales bacterium]|nr:DUF2764 family protein [Bacteroidales bacterium]
MSREYHYLVAGLPDLLIDDSKLSFDGIAFRELLKENVSSEDFNVIKLYFWRFDNQNILNKLQHQEAPLDPRGNLTESEIDDLFTAQKEDSLHTLGDIPPYMGKFIQAYKEETDIYKEKNWDLQLSQLYFEFIISSSKGFIRNWFSFELDLLNILTAAKCRLHELNVEKQLIGSGDIVEKLSRSNAKDFGLDNEFPMLNEIQKALDESDPLEQEKKIDILKWNFIDENVFFYYFTIEKLFSFLLKLSLVERWLALDKETGKKLFNELLDNLEASYEFPKEFIIKK